MLLRFSRLFWLRLTTKTETNHHICLRHRNHFLVLALCSSSKAGKGSNGPITYYVNKLFKFYSISLKSMQPPSLSYLATFLVTQLVQCGLHLWGIPSGDFLFVSTSPHSAVSGGKRETWPTFFMVSGLLANYIRIRVCCVELDGLWPSSVTLLNYFMILICWGGIRCKSCRKCSPPHACILFMRESSFEESRGGCPY